MEESVWASEARDFEFVSVADLCPLLADSFVFVLVPLLNKSIEESKAAFDKSLMSSWVSLTPDCGAGGGELREEVTAFGLLVLLVVVLLFLLLLLLLVSIRVASFFFIVSAGLGVVAVVAVLVVAAFGGEAD